MKQEINIESIWKFNYENKLKSKDSRLLFEAFRRMEFLGGGKDIDDKMLGLGSPSYYKSPYFTASFPPEIPRANNWYRLTESGKEMVLKMYKYFLIPSKPVPRNKLNETLYSF